MNGLGFTNCLLSLSPQLFTNLPIENLYCKGVMLRGIEDAANLNKVVQQMIVT
jgi:hypothetical protein